MPLLEVFLFIKKNLCSSVLFLSNVFTGSQLHFVFTLKRLRHKNLCSVPATAGIGTFEWIIAARLREKKRTVTKGNLVKVPRARFYLREHLRRNSLRSLRHGSKDKSKGISRDDVRPRNATRIKIYSQSYNHCSSGIAVALKICT